MLGTFLISKPSKKQIITLIFLSFFLLLIPITVYTVSTKTMEIRKEASQDGGFTFAALSDTHAGIDPNEYPKYHEWANYNHQGAIDMIRSLNPDFYLNLGDLVQEPTNFAWREFFAIESSLINSKPIYPTIGNHEKYTEDKSFYYKFSQYSHLTSDADPHLKKKMQISSPWYSFDWGNVHFVSLRVDYDSWYPQGEACRPGSPQYQWLENDLKSTDKPWKIVFFHVQIYSSTSQYSQQRLDMRGYLHPLFKQYGVDLVFGGHDHYYERVEKDGIVYIECGAGGNRGTPPDPKGIPRKQVSEKNNIVKVNINGGQLTGTAISTRSKGKGWTDPGGATLDTFILTKQIQPTASLSFKIKFQGINEHRGDKKVKVTLGNGPIFENINVTSDSSGVYSGTVSNIVPGAYNLYLKGWSHLQKRFENVTLNVGENGKDWSAITLLTGDAVANNRVDIYDYNRVVEHFGPRIPAGGSPADFDLDGDVDIFDYNFLVSNFNQGGD